MPWAFPDRPAIGPSLLQKILEEAGFHSQVIYPGSNMIHSTGQVFYNYMSNDMACYELSEHFFSCCVHGKDRVQSDTFFEYLKEEKDNLEDILGSRPQEFFKQIRDVIVPNLIDELAYKITERDIPAVGFSCTFNQVMASLALAKKIKAIKPEVKTLFGGPSFDCEMGIAHHQKYHDIVDHIFLGEADDYIADIVRNIGFQNGVDSVPGLTVFKDGSVKNNSLYCIAKNLDDVPVPNYDDFYLQRREAEENGCELPPVDRLTFEGSRECWWATKSACSFCGLNGGRSDFRSKSPSRVVSELEELSTRYATLDFRSSDNIIDMSFFKELFPVLEKSGLDYSLWYQTKTNLKKKDIRALKRGKVTLIQAGIESFSDNVLKLMRKGVTGLHNIQLLKWCKEFGVEVSYFILCGFPGETGEDYDKVASVVPLIVHLQPPIRMQHIELHRFSPMFNDPAKFGIDEMFMREHSNFIYPEGILEENLLYSFRYYSSKTIKVHEYTKNLKDVVHYWRNCYYYQNPSPVLEMRVGKDFLLIHDTRSGGDMRYYLNEIQKEIILLGDSICATWKIHKALQEKFPQVSGKTFDEEIKTLAKNGLIIVDHERIVALPVKSTGRSNG